MLLLLTDPRIGLSLTLEAGISSGESAELIDVDCKRAVGFRDHPIISHALNMGLSAGSGKPGSTRSRRPVVIKLTRYPALLLRCTECGGAGCGFCRRRCEALAAPSPFEPRPIELHDEDADRRTQIQVVWTFAAKLQYYVINRLVLILSDIGKGLPHDSFQP